MKKLFKSMFMLAIAAFAFTSCEDVPMPYDDPNNNTPGGEEPPTVVVDPAGNGTATDPYNVAAALEIIKALDADVQTEPMYVKGKICNIKQVELEQYGNALYYISDDGTDNKSARLYIFQSYYLGNVKFTSEDQIKVGDEVVIYGKFVNYSGNTPETVGKGSSYIYSLNGNTSGGGSDKPSTGEAKGDGTLDNPFNSVAANQYAASLAAGETSDKVVYIKGKVVSIKEQFGTQFGNATFYISDDGTSTDQFYVFRTLYLNNAKYTEGDLLSVGDDVVVCGKVTNYMGNTPETVQNESYLYSWTKNGGGSTGGDTPGGEVTENSITVTASSFGLDNGTEVGTKTLSDGTVLSFDGGGNSNSPKYYNTGTNIRMYPKNSVKITAKKKIASVIFNCDEYNGTIYNASGDVAAVPGTVKTDGKTITTSGINSTETTISNTSGQTGPASQIRIVSLTINYAE